MTYIALPWPTHHRTTQSVILSSNLNHHSLCSAQGGRKSLQLLKTCVLKLNSLIVIKSGEKSMHVARKDHFRSPDFAKLPATMQWKHLSWYQINFCKVTAKGNYLCAREKGHALKEEESHAVMRKYNRVLRKSKLLICPCPGRENCSSRLK